jgi:hypothetical protein
VHGVGLEIFDDDVGLPAKVPGNPRTVYVMEIKRDGSFVPVEQGVEASTGTLVLPGPVAFEWFHAYYVGPEVSKGQTADRAHDEMRELDDADSLQRQSIPCCAAN